MLVFVTRSLSGTNGADRVAGEILSALVATGESVAVVLRESLDSRAARPAAARWVHPPAQVRFPTEFGSHWPRRFASWVKWSIRDVPRQRELQRLSARLVLVNGFGSHDFWMRLPMSRDGKSALIVHESPRHFGGRYQARSVEWAIAAMETYSHLVFVSERCLREWTQYPTLARRSTFAIPNCCREDEIARVLRNKRSAVRERLAFGPDQFIGVCVSTVQHRKGQDLLVESLPELSRRVPGIVLELVGNTINSTEWVIGSRGYQAELLRRVEELGLGDRVRFRGPRDDALDFIYAADVLLLPSRAEAMPLVVLEAMALGTPVVVSGVDGLPELVEHGVTGLLFDPARPEMLVPAVERIARDPAFSRGMAERGRERYWREFSAERLRERYAAAVIAICAGREDRMPTGSIRTGTTSSVPPGECGQISATGIAQDNS